MRVTFYEEYIKLVKESISIIEFYPAAALSAATINDIFNGKINYQIELPTEEK